MGPATWFPARLRAGARLSLEESRRKEHQGGRDSSSLDPPFLVGGTLRGPPSFFAWPAAHLSHARNGPPTSWAGWEGWFRRREGKHSPKPSPRGEGAPVRTLGRMRGRACTQPFLVENRRSPDCRLNEVFLLLRWACRSPPHQSPSVTASPQGEASGLCSPTRKSVPNQGTYMGTVLAPPPFRCASNAKTSEWERAGH